MGNAENALIAIVFVVVLAAVAFVGGSAVYSWWWSLEASVRGLLYVAPVVIVLFALGCVVIMEAHNG